jgi:hypothetical protein
LASFLGKEIKIFLQGGKRLFFSQESSPKKSFCLRMMKNRQHQHKGKPNIQEKIQDAAVSVEDAILIFRGLNLCGVLCML